MNIINKIYLIKGIEARLVIKNLKKKTTGHNLHTYIFFSVTTMRLAFKNSERSATAPGSQ
jgi:hypothetical protein